MTIIIETADRPGGKVAVSVIVSTEPPPARIATYHNEHDAIGAALVDAARRTGTVDYVRRFLP